MFKKVALIAVAGTALLSGAATAAQVSDNLAVTADITGTCTITSAATLAFGTNTSTGSNIDAQQNISVNCTSGVDYTIGMNNGANALGLVRRMASGGNFMTYDVYTAATRLPAESVSAVGTAAPANFIGTGTGGAQTITVFGRVPSQSTPPVGTYTDTLVVTLQY
jgi:spore coat protein U-like protein